MNQSQYEKYLEKYVANYNRSRYNDKKITLEEAAEHVVCKEVKKHYEEKKLTNGLKTVWDLVFKEMDFSELDSFMVKIGYYSVLDDGIIDSIKRDKKIYYTSVKPNECEAKIDFEIKVNNGKDEVEDNFILKVLNVQVPGPTTPSKQIEFESGNKTNVEQEVAKKNKRHGMAR